jgi:hypothetical protein
MIFLAFPVLCDILCRMWLNILWGSHGDFLSVLDVVAGPRTDHHVHDYLVL